MQFGTRSGSMRDRRNTNLSISSTASSVSLSSHASPVSAEIVQDSAEKGRYLWIPLTQDDPLPSPLLKHARETSQPLLKQLQTTPRWRNLAMLAALAFISICIYLIPSLGSSTAQPDATFSQSDKQVDLINGAPLPQHPTPVIFQDNHGKPRWTVSIPPSAGFPLKQYEYRQICEASEGVSKSIEAMGGRSRIQGKGREHYWRRPYSLADKAFMAVDEAEELGYLPSMPEGQKHIAVVGRTNETNADLPVCESSLTFVMETDNAGFGNSLLPLWLSYGLAKKEGRAFFIDDSEWSYGNYSAYFPSPPQPSCAAPPANQLLPCPHTARHLVVSAGTLPWTFGSAFKAEYQSTLKHGFNKNRRIYDLARQGYDDLFSLKGEDHAFLMHKLKVLRDAATASQTPIVGMHIRRGDRHPFELQYSNDYLPFERYTSAAAELFSSFSPNKSSSDPTALLLASDDPDIISSPDLLNTLPAHLTVSRPQERIVLASKKTLEPAVPIREPGSAYVKHVDENSGWEGGFYASLFFALGKGHPSSHNHQMDDQLQQAALQLRELVGRAYVLDLTILSKSDAVVCASSSAACRLIAVMMGPGKVSKGHWKNVDTSRPWSWDGRE